MRRTKFTIHKIGSTKNGTVRGGYLLVAKEKRMYLCNAFEI